MPGNFHDGLKSAIPGLIGRSRERHRFLWKSVKMSSGSDTDANRTICRGKFLTAEKCDSNIELADTIIYKCNRHFTSC